MLFDYLEFHKDHHNASPWSLNIKHIFASPWVRDELKGTSRALKTEVCEELPSASESDFLFEV
jgi:hypothetical protein